MIKRNRKTRGLLLVLILLLVMPQPAPVLAADLNTETFSGGGLFVADGLTGEELWSRNADQMYVPASTTKMMTMYLVFEAIAQNSISKRTQVPISFGVQSLALNYAYSNVPLYSGGTYYVDELIYAVVLESACGATLALAELLAGSESAFVDRMNAKAAELGIANRYYDCSGISSRNQVTPRGEAALAYRIIRDYPDYLNYSSTNYYLFHGSTGIYNTNKFINGTYVCEGNVDGIKTGTSSAAGCCLTASAVKNGRRVIAVVLNSGSDSERYEDAKKLIEYGFKLMQQKPEPVIAVPGEYTLSVGGDMYPVTTYEAGESRLFRLRDLAYLLQGTTYQIKIEESIDGTVTITGGTSTEPLSCTGIIEEAGAVIAEEVSIVIGKQTFPAYRLDGEIYIALTEFSELTGVDTRDNREGKVTELLAIEHVAPFSDVYVSQWFAPAVSYVFSRGIMNGVSEDIFEPEQPLSRAMVVQILYNLEGRPATDSVPTDMQNAAGNDWTLFADVREEDWYSQAVLWAFNSGIVQGKSDIEFDPKAPVLREDLMLMIYRYSAYRGGAVSIRGELSGFSDAAEIDGYALDACSWAVGSGIIAGKGGGILAPHGTASRAEAAQIFKNMGNSDT